jgi:hypothetical protein
MVKGLTTHGGTVTAVVYSFLAPVVRTYRWGPNNSTVPAAPHTEVAVKTQERRSAVPRCKKEERRVIG